MIDGRTVGEVVPNSASAKEISELWIYIQERLSRIVRDPALLPVRPDHLSINALLSPGVEGAVDLLPPVLEQPVYDGPERRSGLERRTLLEPRLHERRSSGGVPPILRPPVQIGVANEQHKIRIYYLRSSRS